MNEQDVLEMVSGEHLAFEHAAKLCREYRQEIRSLKWLIATLSISLLITIGALIKILVEVL